MDGEEKIPPLPKGFTAEDDIPLPKGFVPESVKKKVQPGAEPSSSSPESVSEAPFTLKGEYVWQPPSPEPSDPPKGLAIGSYQGAAIAAERPAAKKVSFKERPLGKMRDRPEDIEIANREDQLKNLLLANPEMGKEERIEIAEKLSEGMPEIKQDLIEKADRVVQGQERLKEVTGEIIKNPDRSDLLYEKGYIESEIGEDDKAVNSFLNAIGKNPDDMLPYYGLAHVSGKKGDIPGAISFYDTIIEKTPQEPTAYNNRAIYKYRNGDLDGAMEDFSKTIELDPNNYSALINRYKLNKMFGNKEQADDDYKKASVAYTNLKKTSEKEEIKKKAESYNAAHGTDVTPDEYYWKVQRPKDLSGFVDAFSKGEGMFAFFNPLGAAVGGTIHGVETTKKGVEQIKRGEIAKGTVKALSGVIHTGLALSTPLIPEMAGVAPTLTSLIATAPLAEEVPGLKEVYSLALAPVTTIVDPESETGKEIAGIADLIVVGLLSHAGEKKVADKIRDKKPITEEDIQIARDIVRQQTIGDLKTVVENIDNPAAEKLKIEIDEKTKPVEPVKEQPPEAIAPKAEAVPDVLKAEEVNPKPEEPDAIQEPVAAEIPVREAPADSKKVEPGVWLPEEPTGESIVPPKEKGPEVAPEGVPEKGLGIKKALVPQEKIESFAIERKSEKEMHEIGKQMVESGEVQPEMLVKEILKSPRALQPKEVVALVYHRTRLEKAFDNITENIKKADEEGNENAAMQNRLALEVLEKDLNDFHEVALHTANQQSLAFRLRKMLVDKEYSLVEQERKYKSINQGELPADIAEKFKKYDEELKAVNKQMEEIKAQMEEAVKAEVKKVVEETTLEKRSKVRVRKVEEIRAERKVILNNIKEKLRKSRGETQAAIVPYAKELFIIAPDIGKLTKNYIEEGIVKFEDIVDKMYEDFKEHLPDIQKSDVVDLIAGKYKRTPKEKDALTKQVVEMRSKARLIQRLKDLESGEIKEGKNRPEASEEIQALRKQIGEHETKRITDLKNRYERDIKRYEERLEKMDFEEAKAKEKPALDKKMRELEYKRMEVREKFDIEQEKAIMKNQPMKVQVYNQIANVLSLPKSLMASMDLSAPLRQGVIMSVAHPILAKKAFAEMLRQAASEKAMNNWLRELRMSEAYQIMKKHELYIAEPNAKLTAREEQFSSNLTHKIPGLKHIAKGSERAYAGYLNKLRADVFMDFHDTLMADAKKRGLKKEEIDKELTAFAKFVNNATGRGSLGKFEDAAQLLNTWFFSPRYVISRFNLLNPMIYASMPKAARMEALKSMGAYIGTGLTILALSKAAGAEVEEDPRATDFGKIKVGNVRYDLWAGFQQTVRMLTQVASGEKKTSKGEIRELGKGFKADTRLDVLERFGRSKLSPSFGFAANMLTGKDFMGEEFKTSDELLKLVMPLYLSDIQEIYNEQGVSAGTLTALAAFFGTGVQVYDPIGKKAQPAYKEKYYEGFFPTNK